MRDYRDAKSMAHTLRQTLKAQSIAITHSNALELIAKILGFRDWQVLAARIESTKVSTLSPGQDAAPAKSSVMHCSFCAKSQHEVKKLIAGPDVFICDECTGLCNDIMLDQDPLVFVGAEDRLRSKSPAQLLDLAIKCEARVAGIGQTLNLIGQLSSGVDNADDVAHADPKRSFLLRKTPAERAAYAADLRSRLSGVERVASTVAGLLQAVPGASA